jgi:hypothetical protein
MFLIFCHVSVFFMILEALLPLTCHAYLLFLVISYLFMLLSNILLKIIIIRRGPKGQPYGISPLFSSSYGLMLVKILATGYNLGSFWKTHPQWRKWFCQIDLMASLECCYHISGYYPNIENLGGQTQKANIFYPLSDFISPSSVFIWLTSSTSVQ